MVFFIQNIEIFCILSSRFSQIPVTVEKVEATATKMKTMKKWGQIHIISLDFTYDNTFFDWSFHPAQFIDQTWSENVSQKHYHWETVWL